MYLVQLSQSQTTPTVYRNQMRHSDTSLCRATDAHHAMIRPRHHFESASAAISPAVRARNYWIGNLKRNRSLINLDLGAMSKWDDFRKY